MREWQRNALLSLVGTLAVAAAGAAVNVRDRIGCLEERREADQRVYAEREAWLEKTLTEIRDDVRALRARSAP